MAERNKSSNLVCSLILSALDEWELNSGSLEKPHRSIRSGDSCHTLNYFSQTPILELKLTFLLLIQLAKPNDRLTHRHRKHISDILLTFCNPAGLTFIISLRVCVCVRACLPLKMTSPLYAGCMAVIPQPSN